MSKRDCARLGHDLCTFVIPERYWNGARTAGHRITHCRSCAYVYHELIPLDSPAVANKGGGQ